MRAHNYPFDMGHLLTLGEKKIRSEWERNFISGLRDKFGQYGYDMFLSEKQATVLCRIAGVTWDGTCGDYFEYGEDDDIEAMRREQARKEQERASKEREKQEQKRRQEKYDRFWRKEEPKTSSLAPEFVKRLLHLCHPDKHGGSKMATEVTAQLLKMR